MRPIFIIKLSDGWYVRCFNESAELVILTLRLDYAERFDTKKLAKAFIDEHVVAGRGGMLTMHNYTIIPLRDERKEVAEQREKRKKRQS